MSASALREHVDLVDIIGVLNLVTDPSGQDEQILGILHTTNISPTHAPRPGMSYLI